ncbi:hypothetical protein [Methanobrevibacter sp.]|uniref:hypothetical protein n=1 Tax=Methanobrevibacter sp. TaxID=66852 RepID=UPI0025DC318E|nr:hypothetical protein [Methanobrevibacter sp.]MBQ6512915.1 hypothetical protein [Methanobrevibacter sp.]
MDLNKKLLTLLAIFCLIVSAGVVCAADQDGYAGINYQNMNGVSGSQYAVADGLEPGNGLPLENQTGYVPLDADGNPILNATGNATGNATQNVTANVTSNVTANATHNVTAQHTMPVTGNPIIALLAVTGIIGGYAVLRRNN